MDHVTELSGLVSVLSTALSAGNYRGAMESIAAQWIGRSPVGTVYCTLPDFPGTWVRFATRGYPFALRRLWAETKDDRTTMEAIILPRVEAWNFVSATNGLSLPLPPKEQRPLECLDDLDDPLLVWLINAFWQWWRAGLHLPRPNSLPPSRATS